MNLNSLGRVSYALVLLLWAAAAKADPIDAARAEVRDHLAPKAPGFSVAVGKDGKIVWSEGFGFADVAAHQVVTPETQFRVGSVSKTFTAVGLMLLVEQGKVDLDADIHKYVPTFPDKGAVITTRELAGHLAGFRHYRGTEFNSDHHYESLLDGLRIFQDDPLLFKPGEKFSYSSYGFNLIGVVMESAAHGKYSDWMQHAVFAPLHLTNTMPEVPGHEPAACTRFYTLAEDKTNFVIAPMVDNGFKLPSGGYLSSPEDMVRFGFAMLQPGLLKESSLKVMLTSQKTADGHSTGYGVGWMVRQDAHGGRIWTHTGGAMGGSAELVIYPDRGLVIAMAANYLEAMNQAAPSIKVIEDDFSDRATTNGH